MDDIREKLDTLPADYIPSDLNEEPVSQGFGKERPGRVRGLGYGCSQKDVKGSGRLENEKIQWLQQERNELQEKVEILAMKNETLSKDFDELKGQMIDVVELVKALTGMTPGDHARNQGA